MPRRRTRRSTGSVRGSSVLPQLGIVVYSQAASGNRGAMAIGLVDHFNIVISPSQVDDTLRFYKDVLGLKEGFRPDFGRPGWWLYAGDHPVLHISLKKDIPPTLTATASFDHIPLTATGSPQTTTNIKP